MYGSGHLVVLEAEVVVSQAVRLVKQGVRVFGAEVLLEPKDSMVALKANAIHVYCLIAEEVNNTLTLHRSIPQEDPRRDYQTKNLLEEDEDLHLVQRSELGSHFVAMQTVFPVSRR